MSESSGAQQSVASAEPTMSQADTGPAQGTNSPAKHRVKIDGQERELTTDDLIRDYQLREASNKRFQEASQMQKQLQPILEAMQKGDFKALLGPRAKDPKFRQFAEEFLIEQLQYEELPEPEKRRLAAEERARQLEEELKALQEKGKKSEYDSALQAAETEVDNEISEALVELGWKPAPHLVLGAVDEMIAHTEATGKKLPAKKALELAVKRYDKNSFEYLDSLTPETLVQKLSPKTLEAIRKHFLGQVGMQQASPKQQPGTAQQKPQRSREPEKPRTIDEAFKQLEAQFGGKRRKA